MRLILLGAPGSGKGTQAELMTKRLGMPAISTGDILRKAIKDGTEMGALAEKYMTAGQLVPDDVMVGIIKDRLKQQDCINGFILDGFPRTLSQAQALEAMHVAIDSVLSFEIADEVIKRRLTGRRVCAQCGAIYHIERLKPRVEGVCDSCGGALTIRKDDQPETVVNRLRVFNETIDPIKDFYRRQGKLKMLGCDGDREEVYKRSLELLGIEE